MISIIVPIYNAEKYLPQCIESICNQTYQDLEIVLVDDGSTDDSFKICKYYQEKDSRIAVIHKENSGAIDSRKVGVAYSSGEYLAFADGDDWLEPDMLECLFMSLVHEEVDIAMCGRYEDTGSSHRAVYHGIPAGRYNKQELIENVYPMMISNGSFFEWGIFPVLWDKLYRRECLERFIMEVDTLITMGDDAACVYLCILNADSICILDKCLYHYRQTSASMIKQKEDTELERHRFRILYTTVMKSLEQNKTIFDLTGQWREFVLFLMVPRADTLLEGIERLDYLFPFRGIRKGSTIIIYGMGTYGQRLYSFVTRTGFCKVAALVDRNYIELRKQGIPVESPDSIIEHEFDTIAIACSFSKVRKAIYNELTVKYGNKKVHVMDENLIKSQAIMKAFGLE